MIKKIKSELEKKYGVEIIIEFQKRNIVDFIHAETGAVIVKYNQRTGTVTEL